MNMKEAFATVLPAHAMRENEPFSAHTTFEIGGPAELMVWPETAEQLAGVLRVADREHFPVFILGNGSNLLVSDAGMDGVIINTSKLCNMDFSGEEVHVECGVLLADLSKAAAARGLSGLEFACGIPGSVGGAVFMNAGAYDGEMREVITQVEVVDLHGDRRKVPAAEMDFSYRHSRLKDEPLICVAADMKLAVGNRDEIDSTIAELTERRESRQPLELPSAGSTFKRPTGHYAGPLIIEAGMQGKRIGGAEVSMKHAGFIVNQGGATARDVLDLIAAVQEAVFEHSGVQLEPEVRMVGRPLDE